MAKFKSGPHKANYMRDMLAAAVFESDERFYAWVDENYTDAVKELGKLQPKTHAVGGDESGVPIKHLVERTIFDSRKDSDS